MKNLWDKYTDLFGNTIFHPQFIMLSFTNRAINIIKKVSAKNKKLLDIGCGRMSYRKQIEPFISSYTGIDYKPTAKLYRVDQKPEFYGDAHALPFQNKKFDIAIMLQSIEYFYDPSLAINEAHRVLKKDGYLIITSPFMYPLHDKPFDRFRFTDTQLRYILNESKFQVEKIIPQGGFFDFSIQSFLVFWFKSGRKNPILLIPAIVLVPVLNSIALGLRYIQGIFYANNDFPLNYLVLAKKK